MCSCRNIIAHDWSTINIQTAWKITIITLVWDKNKAAVIDTYSDLFLSVNSMMPGINYGSLKIIFSNTFFVNDEKSANTETAPGELQWLLLMVQFLNSLTCGRFKVNFRWVIFKLIFVVNGWGISCETALIWVPLDHTYDKSTMVQVMAWCRQY